MQTMVRINNESEKGLNNKVLDKLYNRVLTVGHEDINYEKIPIILGIETVWGMDDGLHNDKLYIIKSGCGNELDINVQVFTGHSDEAFIESQLSAIAAAMQ